MNSRQLNQLLVSTFPHLKTQYEDEVSWQDGDDTGSHVVYGDLLVPILDQLMESGNLDEAEPYFAFIEHLLELNDDYGANVATVTLIEGLYFGTGDRDLIPNHLGPLSQNVWAKYYANAA